MKKEESANNEQRQRHLGVRLTDAEKRAFRLFCNDRDKTPSAMLRLMLSRVCPGEIEPGDLPTRAAKDTPLFLRLNKPEVVSIRERAKREGTTPQGWVRKLIRANLRKTPQFTRDEESALLQSNRELAHLGRNINQIAHNLNISLNATDLVNAERLEALACELNAHRARVSALINASWGRFSEGEGGDV